MKVYVKKGEYQSGKAGIIIMSILFSIVFIFCIPSINSNEFIHWLTMKGDCLIAAGLCWGGTALIIYEALKRPRKYTATLIDKKEEIYDGENITYMKFSVYIDTSKVNEYVEDEYTCFTYGSNDLNVDRKYDVYIKEFNSKITKIVEKIDNNIIPHHLPTAKPIYIIVEIVLILNVLLGIIGLMYNKEYEWVYILWILLFSVCIFYSLKYFKKLKDKNNKY